MLDMASVEIFYNFLCNVFILLVCMVLLSLIAFAIYTYSMANAIPSIHCPPGRWPIIGHIPEIIKSSNPENSQIWLQYISEKTNYQPWYFQLLGTRYLVIVTDPKMIIEMLRNSQDYSKATCFYSPLSVLIGQHNIVGMNAETSKPHRHALNPHFAQSKQKSVFTIIVNLLPKAIKIMDTYADNGQVLDLCKFFKKLTTDIICAFLFGEDFGCLESDNHVIQEFFDEVNKIAFVSVSLSGSLFEYFPNFKFFRLRKAVYKLFIDKFSSAPPDSAVGELYHSRKYSDQDLCEMIAGLVHAGHDTTSNVLSCCIGKYLCDREDIVKEIRNAECKLSEDISQWSVHDHRIEYVTAVFNETLRCTNPVGGHPMMTTKDVTLGEYKFKKGTYIEAHYWTMFHNQTIFGSDAEDFRPSRWLDGTVDNGARSIGMTRSQIFIPFLSLSQHLCLGRLIAETEGYLILLAFVKKYDFIRQGDYEDWQSLLLGPKQLLCRVKKVQQL